MLHDEHFNPFENFHADFCCCYVCDVEWAHYCVAWPNVNDTSNVYTNLKKKGKEIEKFFSLKTKEPNFNILPRRE